MDAAMIDDVTGYRRRGGGGCYQFYDMSLHNSPFIAEVFVWMRIYQQFSRTVNVIVLTEL